MMGNFNLSIDPLQWSALESEEGLEAKAPLKHIVDFKNWYGNTSIMTAMVE